MKTKLTPKQRQLYNTILFSENGYELYFHHQRRMGEILEAKGLVELRVNDLNQVRAFPIQNPELLKGGNDGGNG